MTGAAQLQTTGPKTLDTRPFAAFEWMLARRYLRARRKEGFISVIAGFSFVGIMLGVATLIVVMSVMSGFRKELYDKILGINGHVFLVRVGQPFTDYQAIAEKAAEVPGVRHVMPIVEGQAMVMSSKEATGAFVRGLRANDVQALPQIARHIELGSLDGFDDGDGVVIGMRLAQTLGVTVGDGISLVSPKGPSTPFGTAPRIKRYKVAAIFSIGMTHFDRVLVIMPLAEAQRYFNYDGAVERIDMMVQTPEKVADMHQAIRAAVGPGVAVADWRRHNQEFLTVLEVERITMFIILSLIVLVAALNIISGLMMLVKDKGRNIAILRTMGATKGAIMRIFVITGASIGIVGTIAGLILGLLFCAHIDEIRQFVSWLTGTKIFPPEVYQLSKLPARLDLRETSFIVAMAMVLSILATLYPSWRASRLDPVEALRYE